MSKVLLTGQLVRLQCCVQVVEMDTQGNSHQHLPRALHNPSIHAQQIGTLQRLKSKVVVIKIPAIHNCIIESLRILHHHFIKLLRNQGRFLLGLGVHIVKQTLDVFREAALVSLWRLLTAILPAKMA